MKEFAQPLRIMLAKNIFRIAFFYAYTGITAPLDRSSQRTLK
jgi:hypothetical protein